MNKDNFYSSATIAQRTRSTKKDFIDGLKLWNLWGRLCFNEVKRRYRRTLLGPMWVAISLGIFALVLSVVWAALWKQNVREYLPYLLSGLIPWMMIASSIGESTSTFMSAEALLKSRQFPYTMLMHVVIGRNVIVFGHNLLTFLIAALLCSVPINLYTLLVFPGFLLLIVNLSWICLLIATLCLRFRDFQQLVTILLQVIMFITPVFWPVSQLTGRTAIIVDINLLYHMIDLVRSPLLGKPPSLESYIVCCIAMLLGWFAVFKLFSKKRHRLVYWF